MSLIKAMTACKSSRFLPETHLISLNGSLHFQFLLFDGFDNYFCQFLIDTLLNGQDLALGTAAGIFRFAVFQALRVQISAYQLVTVLSL